MTGACVVAFIAASFYSGVPVRFIAVVAVVGLTALALCAAGLQLFVSWRNNKKSSENTLREHQGDVLHVQSR